MINNETCIIDWNKPGIQIINLIRALNPAPGAVTPVEGMKIWRAEQYGSGQSNKKAIPGEVITSDQCGLAVNTADSTILITELQAKGGKKMSTADYLRGHKMPVGTKL